MGRHKNVSCRICFKSMRSDNLKRHLNGHREKDKYPMKQCTVCHKTMIAWNLHRHRKIHQQSTEQILQNAKADQLVYDNMQQTGQILEYLLNKEDIDPNSLRKEYINALEVNSFKNRNNKLDKSLKPWQKSLLELMKPTEREIIWVSGEKGAEGKSWFQEYSENYYGSKRVFRTTMNRNTDSILHCLSKRTLPLIDVFVFNTPRSFDVKDIPYTLLEEIKDGQAISSKYNSKVLNFKKPNILIIFSNKRPCITGVSKDRWRIYKIQNDSLCQ